MPLSVAVRTASIPGPLFEAVGNRLVELAAEVQRQKAEMTPVIHLPDTIDAAVAEVRELLEQERIIAVGVLALETVVDEAVAAGADRDAIVAYLEHHGLDVAWAFPWAADVLADYDAVPS